VEAVEKSGLTPLEYMLSVMRDVSLDPRDRLSAANSAAPYVHAKLSSVEMNLSGSIETVTKEQRDAAVAAASRANT